MVAVLTANLFKIDCYASISTPRCLELLTPVLEIIAFVSQQKKKQFKNELSKQNWAYLPQSGNIGKSC